MPPLTLMGRLRAPFDILVVFGLKLSAYSRTLLIRKSIYKPIGPNELRLLAIHPPRTTRRDELVRCTLHHVSLDNPPEYRAWEATADPELRLQKKTAAWLAHAQAQKAAGHKFPRRYAFGDYIALSYCWGSGTRSHRIIVNGRIIAVTETLESALRSARADWGTTRIWADALCINQEDIAERGQEVRRMRQIYGDTLGVLVHLGPEADNSTLAMQYIAGMAKNLRDGVDMSKFMLQMAVDIGEGKLARPERDGLIAMFKLLCRPYWSRMWIIQELAMGDENITIGCGDGALNLAEVRQILKFIVLNQESFNVIVPQEVFAELGEAYQSTIQLLWSNTRLRELALLPSEREATFSELCHPMLRLAQYASVTDPRDKVYGAMGLMPASLATRVDKKGDNYKLTTNEVFMNFTRSIIEVTNDLDVIYTGSLQQKELSRLGLPTWSPDWTLRPGRSAGTGSSQEWYFGEDPRYANFDKSYKMPSTSSRDPSRSDGGRTPKIRFSDNGKLLLCEGFQIATVSGVCTEIEASKHVSPELEVTVQGMMVDSPYGSEEETAQALLRTLLLDANGTQAAKSIIFSLPWFGSDSDPFGDYGDDTNLLVEEMTTKGWDISIFGGGLSSFDVFRHQISQFVIGGRKFKDYFPDHVKECLEEASPLEFSIVVANTVGRKLVTSEKGHIGLAPVTVVPRDKVFVLVGCSMPIILRPDASGEFWEVVGECFVDGFMKGEAMRDLDEGKYELREMVLC